MVEHSTYVQEIMIPVSAWGSRLLWLGILLACLTLVLLYPRVQTHLQLPLSFVFISTAYRGPSSSVGIATDCGLDGPGPNPGGDEIFRQSRLAVGSTPPPVKWVPIFPGGKVRPGRAADHSPPSSAAVMEE